MEAVTDFPEVDKLARELAEFTGESAPEAVARALREQLAREKKRRRAEKLAEQLLTIGRQCASLPVLDDRTPDEILGYNDQGFIG